MDLFLYSEIQKLVEKLWKFKSVHDSFLMIYFEYALYLIKE